MGVLMSVSEMIRSLVIKHRLMLCVIFPLLIFITLPWITSCRKTTHDYMDTLLWSQFCHTKEFEQMVLFVKYSMCATSFLFVTDKKVFSWGIFLWMHLTVAFDHVIEPILLLKWIKQFLLHFKPNNATKCPLKC